MCLCSEMCAKRNPFDVLERIGCFKEDQTSEGAQSDGVEGEKQRIIDDCDGIVTAVCGTEEPRGGRGRGGGRQAGAKSTEVRSPAPARRLR